MSRISNMLIESCKEYLMDTNYERILNGKKLDLTSKPYNIKFIEKMINFYEEKEEYEKCNVLKKLMNKHYVGNKKKQIELHMTMDKFNSLY